MLSIRTASSVTGRKRMDRVEYAGEENNTVATNGTTKGLLEVIPDGANDTDTPVATTNFRARRDH